jgi:hypothetical protein
MQKQRNFLLAFFFIGFFFTAKASHNRSGEITYKWVGPGPYTYEIKVTTYTNLTVIGGLVPPDRCQDTVDFGDGIIVGVNRSNGTTNSLCGGTAMDGVNLPGGTTRLNEYVTTHTYPGPGSYIISMEDPNRNAGIVNMSASQNQEFYIQSLLVISSFSGPNNSPILTFPPIDQGCVGQCFMHNPGAYDIDGDSLSYELTQCLTTNGAVCSGYTYPNTGSPGYYGVDSITGTLIWCTPQLQGEYNLAMKIKEWRKDQSGNYLLIGFITRDVQIDIGNCVNNNGPHIMINSSDTCILAGSIFNKTIQASDVDNDILTFSANGGSFASSTNPSTFSSSPNPSNPIGDFYWNTLYDHIKRLPYQITMKLKDNHTPISLVDFKTFKVKVIPHPPTNLTTNASNTFIHLVWHKPAIYATSGVNPFKRYNVYRKNGFSSWAHSNLETEPPSYTGFTFAGYTTNNINDTTFFDYYYGGAFVPYQNYSYVVLAEYQDGSTSYVTNTSSNQIYVGIKEYDNDDNSVTIDPNPTTSSAQLIIKNKTDEHYSFEILDITGKKTDCIVSTENTTQLNVFTLHLENTDAGMYFIKIIGNKGTNITKKIIKN